MPVISSSTADSASAPADSVGVQPHPAAFSPERFFSVSADGLVGVRTEKAYACMCELLVPEEVAITIITALEPGGETAKFSSRLEGMTLDRAPRLFYKLLFGDCQHELRRSLCECGNTYMR
ncbi:unnamed protein product [Pleuronectes platessa]|uniref:Uncharacterized protein n=1 Tax=Pleuronectes platessa TaxID=8262 RepID=A0A9N7UGB2_PLEPL|nr:unnamed protein product [Pleuronectes platessa]